MLLKSEMMMFVFVCDHTRRASLNACHPFPVSNQPQTINLRKFGLIHISLKKGWVEMFGNLISCSRVK